MKKIPPIWRWVGVSKITNFPVLYWRGFTVYCGDGLTYSDIHSTGRHDHIKNKTYTRKIRFNHRKSVFL